MSTFILPTHNQAASSWLADVVGGARTIAAALFAAQERQYVAQTVVAKDEVSSRALFRSRMALLALARDCEAHSPSQASELRNLASQG